MNDAANIDGMNEGAGPAMGLADLLGMLRRRAKLIAAVVLSATAIAIAVAWSMAPRYEAWATVMVDPRTKTIMKDADVVSALPADTSSVESEVEILLSRTLALRVIDTLDLRNNPEFSASEGGLLSIFGGDGAGEGDTRQTPSKKKDDALVDGGRDEVLDQFLNQLKVHRRRNTYMIEISFTSTDPVQAARIANAIADAYLKQQLETKMAATGTATDWLEQKLATLRERVVEAERAVAKFKAEHNLIDTENGQRLGDHEIARLLEQSILARTQLAEARAKYEQVQRLIKTPGGRAQAADVLESATIRSLKDQLARLTRREAELQVRYGSRHPEMMKIKAELTDIEKQIDTEMAQVLANTQGAYEVAKARSESLNASLEKLKAVQSVTNEDTVRLRDLEREAKATRSLYEVFLARFKQTAEQQSMQVADSRLIEPAVVPLTKSAPKRLKITAIGFAGGLIAGLGLALLLELMSAGLARPEDFEAATSLAHIASLPQLQDSAGRALTSEDPLHANRFIAAHPQGPFAEAIRAMRMALDANMQPGRGRVVMLATPLANESKTAIASNLALHYALTGRRALLVDGDLRRAVLTRTVLPAGARSGLLECLLRQQPIESAILRDGSTGLCYLPAFGPGQTPVPVPELLSSQATAAAFERLRGLFDIIVVDSPPIVPVVDGRVLAHHADELVFVAEWRRTTKDVARRALRLMAASYEKFVGFVVSEVDGADLGSDYSYAIPAQSRPTTAHRVRRSRQHQPARAARTQIGRAA